MASFPGSAELPILRDAEDVVHCGDFERPLRKQLLALMEQLRCYPLAEVEGDDAFKRPQFVSAEGIIEEVLARHLQCGKLRGLVGIIHTPTPTTPLCTRGEISPGLVDRSMMHDRRRLETVRSRAEILRYYLSTSATLYIVYGNDGLERRSQQQQRIYRETLSEYPECAVDRRLAGPYPKDMVGATYIALACNGEPILFSIQAAQAIDAASEIDWKLWLGPLDHPECTERWKRVSEMLQEVDAGEIVENIKIFLAN